MKSYVCGKTVKEKDRDGGIINMQFRKNGSFRGKL